MKGLLFLNGTPPQKEVLCALDFEGSFVVCADGAYGYLADYAQHIDILAGDFDSLSSNLLLHCKAKKIVRFDKEKDFTDGHLAMELLLSEAQNLESIEIYGAAGDREDHTLSNYSLLLLGASNIQKTIFTDRFSIHLLVSQGAERAISLKVSKGAIISLVPFGDSAHIKECGGLKYPMYDEVLAKHHIKGISNEAVCDDIRIAITGGSLLIFAQNQII